MTGIYEIEIMEGFQFIDNDDVWDRIIDLRGWSEWEDKIFGEVKFKTTVLCT